MSALTEEQIQTLLGSVKEKGAYEKCAKNFVASEDRGWNVSEQFPAKKPDTLYQGFANVKKNGNGEFEGIRIIKHEDVVYLIKQ